MMGLNRHIGELYAYATHVQPNERTAEAITQSSHPEPIYARYFVVLLPHREEKKKNRRRSKPSPNAMHAAVK